MRQLMLDGPGAVRWEEVPDVDLRGAGSTIVRPIAVATCDLDVAVLRGRFRLAGPYPFGHEAVAEVVEIGHDVVSVAAGDVVVVPFQISCGRCGPCRRGRTGNCASHPPLSTYGLGPMGGFAWGGFLADRVLVPHADAMLVSLPPGIDAAAAASVSDNIADAWRTVEPQLRTDPGAEVLVVGGDAGPQSIGLYAVGLAVAVGAGRVVYADRDPPASASQPASAPRSMTDRCPPSSARFPSRSMPAVTMMGLGARSTAPRSTGRARARPCT
ncbi:MAG TPA: alcohol dehydrogenase catalytic domain-containing protein [Actinomycetota bacterium]|nr:alcohol dehydrogenase catalytic domain-containing protein [Actinomycetota bacterium]